MDKKDFIFAELISVLLISFTTDGHALQVAVELHIGGERPKCAFGREGHLERSRREALELLFDAKPESWDFWFYCSINVVDRTRFLKLRVCQYQPKMIYVAD